MAQALWKIVGNFLQNKTYLSYDPGIGVLGIYPKELKTYVHTYRIFIHIYQNLEVNKMDFSRWMDK